MKKHIVLAALGTDRPGVLRDLVKAVTDLGCAVADTRMTVLGNELVITLLATGTWNAVAKLESQAPAIAKRLELDITARRTEARTPRQDMLPYVVDVAALDQPGILYDIADFFASRDINIDEPQHLDLRREQHRRPDGLDQHEREHPRGPAHRPAAR